MGSIDGGVQAWWKRLTDYDIYHLAVSSDGFQTCCGGVVLTVRRRPENGSQQKEGGEWLV